MLSLGVFPLAAQTHEQCEGLLVRYLRLHHVENWDYDWTTAIFLYGALKFDPSNKLLSDSFAILANKAPEITMPDLAALSLPATLVTAEGTEKIKQLTQNFFNTEPLNKIGAINHVGARHRFAWWLPPTALVVPASVWADSMLMYILNGFLLKSDTDFFLRQAKLLARTLLDPGTGLYKHAFYLESREFYPQNSFWARGNLWMSLGMLEILAAQKVPDPILLKEFKSHAHALTRYLTPRGLPTLLNDPSTYPESSATALLAYVLKKGVRLGLLDSQLKSIAETAQLASLGFLKKNGQEYSLIGISGPTTAFKYDWYYSHFVNQDNDLSYGVGSFLLLCSEIPLKL